MILPSLKSEIDLESAVVALVDVRKGDPAANLPGGQAYLVCVVKASDGTWAVRSILGA